MIKKLCFFLIVGSSQLVILILSESPDELRVRLHLKIQKNKSGNDSDRFEIENVLTIDKLLEYKRITNFQLKTFLANLHLRFMFRKKKN